MLATVSSVTIKEEIPKRTQRRKPPDCLTQSSAETKSRGLARSMTTPQLSLQPIRIDCQPPKTRRRGSAIALNPPHSAAQTTASQRLEVSEGNTWKRDRDLQSLAVGTLKVCLSPTLEVRNQKKKKPPTGPPGHVSKALKAWLTGMKPLKNSLPLQGKFDVSPRANAL